MTRRGNRSYWRRTARRHALKRHLEAHFNGANGGKYRWERKYGEMSTELRAKCWSCDIVRPDVAPQRCNVKHLDEDECHEVVGLMLAVASYGRCLRCGSSSVRLFTKLGGEIFYRNAELVLRRGRPFWRRKSQQPRVLEVFGTRIDRRFRSNQI